MTKYREIIRLAGLGLSQTNIALSCNASKHPSGCQIMPTSARNFSATE